MGVDASAEESAAGSADDKTGRTVVAAAVVPAVAPVAPDAVAAMDAPRLGIAAVTIVADVVAMLRAPAVGGSVARRVCGGRYGGQRQGGGGEGEEGLFHGANLSVLRCFCLDQRLTLVTGPQPQMNDLR